MLKHLKKTALFLILFVIYHNVSAQGSFREGYIITKSNDTIHGLISFSNKRIFKTCIFKKSRKEAHTNYHPEDLLGFRFASGKYYISREVEIDKVKKVVFLEFLIKGKTNVYYTRDDDPHYFIEKENERIVELTERDVFSETPDGVKFVKEKTTKAKLRVLMADAPAIYPQIEKTNMSHKSLIKIAKTYHDMVCTSEQCILFERRIKPIAFHWGVYGGTAYNKLNLGTRLKSDFHQGMLFGARAEFENIFPWAENTSVLVGAEFQQFSEYRLNALEWVPFYYKNTRYVIAPADSYVKYPTYYDVNLNDVILKFPVSLNYTFSGKFLRPYFGGGFSNMIFLKQGKDFNYQDFTDEYNNLFPKYLLGFHGTLGLKFNLKETMAVFFELRYERTQNFNINDLLRIKSTSYFITGGIRF